MYDDYNTYDALASMISSDAKDTSREVLDDRKDGKPIPWRAKKMNTLTLADSYQRLGLKKHYRVRDCGTYLEFKRYKHDNTLKLSTANFCKVRLCPMCSWRRSLKIFGQVSKVMDLAVKEKEYKFIFLTLTCKNVEGQDLNKQIDNLFHAYHKMMRRAPIKRAVKGWFRALEITHDTDEYITEERYKNGEKHYKKRGIKPGDTNPNYDTYHPHFHVILMVNKSYFNNPGIYIKQADWVQYWKESMQVDYTPVVDIRRFKTSNKSISKSVAEAAKYAVKDSDFIIKDDDGSINEELTDAAVLLLDQALLNRRLVAFGGELRKLHKLLNLDDAENGDLVNTDNEEMRDDLEYMIERYSWHVGYNHYLKGW